MLLEEIYSFSKDDHDVGQAEELQIKIYLTDNIPVQKSCSALPKPLYPEVKGSRGGGTPIITPTGMCPKFGCLFQGKILLLGMKFE